jgi:hypothetical protein
MWGFFTPQVLTRGIFTPTFTPSNNPMEPRWPSTASSALPRAATGSSPSARSGEVWASEPESFTEDQVAALDLGCTIVTDEGRVTDLNAYYEVSEAERNDRALDMVS